jgi:hypothetical protein
MSGSVSVVRESHVFFIGVFHVKMQPKSAISLMYERAKQLNLPVELDNEQALTVTYRIGDNYSTTGTGSTKQLAKRMAAEKMLELLPMTQVQCESQPKTQHKRTKQHRKFIEQRGSTAYSLSHDINPITRLYQIGQARQVRVRFEQMKKSTGDQPFHCQVYFGETHCIDGFGQSKQLAKRSAAERLLSELDPEFLSSVSVSVPTAIAATTTASAVPHSSPPVKSLLKSNEHARTHNEKKHVQFVDESTAEQTNTSGRCSSVNIDEQLTNACDKLNIRLQHQNELVRKHPEQYQSIVSLSIDDRLLAQFRGQGPSIQRAQGNASLAAWTNLQQLFNGSISPPIGNKNATYRRVTTSTSVGNI